MEARDDGLLARLVGSRLTQVVFVMDYLQLRFDSTEGSPRITYLVWPVVEVSGVAHREQDDGYAQALRSLVTQVVVRTSETREDGLVLGFSGGGLLTANPREAELVGPEIALLEGFPDHEWMVWRPGEEPFEDLG